MSNGGLEMAEDQGDLAPIVIDLTIAESGEVNESFLRMFGGGIKMILQRMFGGASVPLVVRGNKRQVKDFARTLAGEKRYYKDYVKYGLDDPRTYRSKYALRGAVKKFERSTGIDWPFK